MSSTPKFPRPSSIPWNAVIRLLRWDKPAGRLILLIPALWSLVLATNGRPPLLLLAVVVVGT
ncbi:MAG: 4-hydroxybenzoate octaprenyltransferase, partial [Cyanobacteria bacterium P01_F01_bin.153]